MGAYNPLGAGSPLTGVAGQVPATATITNVSSTVLAANTAAVLIFISNIGNQDAYITTGQTAIAGTGVYIAKGDARYFPLYGKMVEEITGITAAGSTILTMQVWE